MNSNISLELIEYNLGFHTSLSPINFQIGFRTNRTSWTEGKQVPCFPHLNNSFYHSPQISGYETFLLYNSYCNLQHTVEFFKKKKSWPKKLYQKLLRCKFLKVLKIFKITIFGSLILWCRRACQTFYGKASFACCFAQT